MASVESINRTLDRIVTVTPQDRGLKLTVELIAYDNGILDMDGRVLNDRNGEGMVPGGSNEAWIAASEVFAMYLRYFARQVRERANARTVEGLIRIRDASGQEFTGATAAELVSKLHGDSRAKADSDADWMLQTAARVALQTGQPIAASNPVAFICGLIELDLIEL